MKKNSQFFIFFTWLPSLILLFPFFFSSFAFLRSLPFPSVPFYLIYLYFHFFLFRASCSISFSYISKPLQYYLFFLFFTRITPFLSFYPFHTSPILTTTFLSLVLPFLAPRFFFFFFYLSTFFVSHSSSLPFSIPLKNSETHSQTSVDIYKV